MWHSNFSGRMGSWNQLRHDCETTDIDQTLSAINSWWYNCPWKPYYLHWDDQLDWPDPWQLLNDNLYCDVARSLGILYTITLLDRADLTDATMVLTDSGDNLVLVDKSKYILNWDQNTIVNTSQAINVKRQYTQLAVKKKYL